MLASVLEEMYFLTGTSDFLLFYKPMFLVEFDNYMLELTPTYNTYKKNMNKIAYYPINRMLYRLKNV